MRTRRGPFMKNVLCLILRTAAVLLLTAQTALSQSQRPPAPADLPPADGQAQPSSAGPQGAPPPWVIPHFRLLREEEDWSYLADPQLRGHDWADPLKYVPLRGARKNWYATIGGEVREWFEQYRNEHWGELNYFPPPGVKPVETNGYLKQRYMLGADVHLGSR